MSSVTTTTKHVHFTNTPKSAQSISTTSNLLLGTPSTTKRLSGSCQQVIEEDYTETRARIIVRSCLADSQLYPVISGHKCNKVTLVPSSLWADMALTVGAYVWNTLRPHTDVPGLNVCDMDVPKSLIAQVPQTQPGQFVEIEAEAELEGELGVMRCKFRSVYPDGSKIQDHATCLLRYESREDWKQDWSRFGHMVKNSIKALQEKAMTSGAHRMQSGLAYKVFESFVTYSDKYRGMNEVVFDGLEGTSSVEFKTGPEDLCGPYHLDNSCHLSGFLCNASDMGAEDNVYISEGWQGFKCLNPEMLTSSPQSKLTNYVLMQPKPKSILRGDVYILKDDEVVAVWEGIAFKRLPRRVINILLPPPKKI
ncbi:hypothetical protein LTR36_009486 [Oleoguttula mirabilis]|uniref:PKS/mFAS DH domain-containing protein n=1 Tax=Oleoguttula mirabilis TaxID=1507867 RepID=A0AAV9JU22_9PEZI|nr:hypothetical protein LTR36_009486 [Oleoguttula mirabilis]